MKTQNRHNGVAPTHHPDPEACVNENNFGTAMCGAKMWVGRNGEAYEIWHDAERKCPPCFSPLNKKDVVQ